MRRPQLRSVFGALLILAVLTGVLAGPTAADDGTAGGETAVPSASAPEPPDPEADPAPPTTETTAPPSDSGPEMAALSAEAEEEGEVRVAVRVADGVDPSAAMSATLAGTDHRIGSESDDVVGVAVDAEGLERLAASPAVESVTEDIVLVPLTGGGGPGGSITTPVRADVVHALGRQGEGRRVAVLDSGVDLSHPTFTGVEVAEEGCFVSTTVDPCEVERGAGAAAPCDLSYAGCDHGTHVTGLLVGQGSYHVPGGIAPRSEIIPIRVLSPDDSGAVTAQSTDIAAAIDLVLELDALAPIDAVNMSLGSLVAYPQEYPCDGELGFLLRDKFAALRAAGIAPVVASGNQGQHGLSYPACISNSIPVAGSDPSTGALWTGANRNANVVVAAPSVEVAGAVPGGQDVKTGTSLAAPQVTAAIALMRQVDPGLGVSSIQTILRRTGQPLQGTGIRQLDVAAAIGGYWVVTDSGDVHPAGLAGVQPRVGPGVPPGESVVAGSPTTSGAGYWLVTDRGTVIGHGDATHHGDMSGFSLNQPIVAMATMPLGDGYWLLARDGGVFTFGDAQFYGSTGNLRLNAPVTDIATSPTGNGYWLTAKDGGVFTFGDAQFYGSTGNLTLNQPVVSMASTASGRGYWLVALDGGVFTFGDASYHGSLPGLGVTSETGYRVRATDDGRGYYIATLQGGVHAFGAAAPISPHGPMAGRVIDLMVFDMG